MTKAPVISVITATYNAAFLIEKTINSVLNQNYLSIEYIIIDGASTDGTIGILEKYKHQIKYISEPDRGIYDAWNKGIKMANGEWIGFLGAGDEYLSNAIESYVSYINDLNDEKLNYISSIVDVVNDERASLYTIGSKWEWPRYLSYMNIAHVGSLHSKKLFEQYGLYNINYRLVGDYELILRAGPDLQAGFIPVITAKMLFGGMSISKKSLKEAFIVKLNSGYISGYKAYFRYYFSLFKASVRFFLYKTGVYIVVRR